MKNIVTNEHEFAESYDGLTLLDVVQAAYVSRVTDGLEVSASRDVTVRAYINYLDLLPVQE